ncbi:MAG TPA: cytochrome c [Gammaproteobacteria bacterium]
MVLTRVAPLRFLLLVAALSAAFGAFGQTAASNSRSIRDGVFTAEQARRGQIAYTGPCDRCHGYKLDGAPDDPDMLPAPPVAGPKFLRKWNGRTLAALFDYLRATMPSNNPGYLSDDEIADLVAYMLSSSDMPAGSAALPTDRMTLAGVLIVSQSP